MQTLVTEGQEETARKLADAWLNGKIELGSELAPVEQLRPIEAAAPEQGLMLTLIDRDELTQRFEKHVLGKFRDGQPPRGGAQPGGSYQPLSVGYSMKPAKLRPGDVEMTRASSMASPGVSTPARFRPVFAPHTPRQLGP